MGYEPHHLFGKLAPVVDGFFVAWADGSFPLRYNIALRMHSIQA